MRAKWVKRRLESFAKIYNGKDYKGNPRGEAYPIYGTGGVMGYTGAMLNSGPAVLTGRKGTIDRPEYVEGDFWHVDTVFCIKPDETVDCKLLYYAFASRNLSYLNEATGVPSVSSSALYGVRFLFPSSTDEQRRIAGILSTCDEVIMRSRSAVEKLRKIKAGMLNDFFTRGIDDDGRLRPSPQQAPKLYKDSSLGPIPKEWEVKRLGEIGDVLMCKRVLKEQTDVMGDIPFFKIGTFGRRPDAYISRMLFESLKAQYSYPRKGDVLISAAGTIGRTVVFDGEDAYFQDSNIVWIDNDESQVLNRFLFYCYSIVDWNTEDGGIVNRLYNDNLKEQLIPCPSVSEQDRIASRLSAIDERIATEERVVAKYRSVKAGLMQRLLSPPTDAEIEEVG